VCLIPACKEVCEQSLRAAAACLLVWISNALSAEPALSHAIVFEGVLALRSFSKVVRSCSVVGMSPPVGMAHVLLDLLPCSLLSVLAWPVELDCVTSSVPAAV
jgi:hypothetical protein